MSINDEYIGIKEAAEFVGCSVSFLRNQIAKGLITCYRLGSVYRFKRDDLTNVIRPNTPHDQQTIE